MIVITGASHPLARALVAALPTTPLRLHCAETIAPLADHATIFAGDVRDRSFVENLLADVETVIHLVPISPPPADAVQAIDEAVRSTYHIANAAKAAGVRKIVLGSTLDLFERCPDTWRVDEGWRPRPTPTPADLRAWLAECTARELARETSVPTVCLRFGQIVDEDEAAQADYNPRWLHLGDATQAVTRSLAFGGTGWSVFHITAAGANSKLRVSHLARNILGYQPQHDFGNRRQMSAVQPTPLLDWRSVFASPEPIPTRPIQRVVVFGAGGPVAAATAGELASAYTLHLTDIQPLEAIIARNEPQSAGAPLPQLLDAPHTRAVVDVGDAAQVLAACADADAILNCSVVRRDPIEAFRVNMLGAYNIMRAAVAHNIRRIVHTGPFLVAPSGFTSYAWDTEVRDDVPPRPGGNHDLQLYFHTKYLGQEICRIFAEYYDLEVPALLFCNFVNSDLPPNSELYRFSVSFQDAARAVRAALSVPALPNPFEIFHINADLPHGVFPNDKAMRVLGWNPSDLRRWWDGGASD